MPFAAMSPVRADFRFPFDVRHLLLLVALTWLASFAHEATHHLVGAAVCGRVGRMSLSLFALDARCGPGWPWSTAAGPALSYLLMWTGMALVLRRRHVFWGFALVIADKPLLRLFTAITGGGDEGLLWRLASPAHGRWLATLCILLLVLPPVVACYRALAPRRRVRVFVLAMVLPMLPILPVPFIDRAVYGPWIAGAEILPAAAGVPWSVWGVELGVLVLLLALALRGGPIRRVAA